MSLSLNLPARLPNRWAFDLWNSLYASGSFENSLRAITAWRWRKTKVTRLVDKLNAALKGQKGNPEKEDLPVVEDKNALLRGKRLWMSLYTLIQAKKPLENLYDKDVEIEEAKKKATQTLLPLLKRALQELTIEFESWEEMGIVDNKINLLEDASFQIDALFSEEDLRTVNTSWTPSDVQITRFKEIAGNFSNETLGYLILLIKELLGIKDSNGEAKEITEDEHKKATLGELESFMHPLLRFFCGMMSVTLDKERSVDQMLKDCFSALVGWHILYTENHESVSIGTLFNEVVAGGWNEARAIRLIEKLTTVLGRQEEGPGQKSLAAVRSYVLNSRGRGLWSFLFELTRASAPLEILLVDEEGVEDASIRLVKKLGQALQELRDEFRSKEWSLENKGQEAAEPSGLPGYRVDSAVAGNKTPDESVQSTPDNHAPSQGGKRGRQGSTKSIVPNPRGSKAIAVVGQNGMSSEAVLQQLKSGNESINVDGWDALFRVLSQSALEESVKGLFQICLEEGAGEKAVNVFLPLCQQEAPPVKLLKSTRDPNLPKEGSTDECERTENAVEDNGEQSKGPTAMDKPSTPKHNKVKPVVGKATCPTADARCDQRERGKPVNDSENERRKPVIGSLSADEEEAFRNIVRKKCTPDVLADTLGALDPNLDLKSWNPRELYDEWWKQTQELISGSSNKTTTRRRRGIKQG